LLPPVATVATVLFRLSTLWFKVVIGMIVWRFHPDYPDCDPKVEPSLKVEFHCHTLYSKDSLNSIDGLLRRIDRLGIDRLAITDHNSIQGALAA
jgi:hypothetical protein